MSFQTRTRWIGALLVIMAFLLALLATALVAWGHLLPEPPPLPSSLLVPGEAALYRVDYGSGRSGLYAIRAALEGPFPFDLTRTGPLIRLEETYTGRPGESEPVRTTSFYAQEDGELRALGVVEALGGNLYSPTLSLWLPGLALGETACAESYLRLFLGPWSFSWDLPYTLTHQADKTITVPAGTFSSARFEWQGAAGSLELRHRFWYGEEGGPFPLVHEDYTTSPPWRYELLSATWLEGGSGTGDPAAEVDAAGPAALYRGGTGRTGQASTPTAGQEILPELPRYWYLAAAEDITSPPLLLGDLLLFGDHAGRLWAVDAASGEVRWTFDTGRPIAAAPAASGGVVYVAAGQRLYALEARAGLYLWSHTATDVIQGSPLVLDGLLLFGAEDGLLHALDARTGTPRWHFAAGAPIVSAASGLPGTVCFGTASGGLFALETTGGRLRWQADLEEPIWTHPVIADQALYVGLGGTFGSGQVLALDLADGRVHWAASVPGNVEAALAVDAAHVYAATGTGLILALDRAGGEERWQARLAEGQANAPLLVGQALVVADTAGTLRVLDGATGQELARRSDLFPIGAGPVYDQGRLFVVDRHRHIEALGFDGPTRQGAFRLALQQDRLLADVERGARPDNSPVGWAGRPLVLLDNGDLWLFEPDLAEGSRLAALGGSAFHPPLLSGDVAYIALAETTDGPGAVVAFDLAAQQIRWQVGLDGPLYAPLALAGGRVLACASTAQGGTLHALDAASGADLWNGHPVPCSGAPAADGAGVYLANGAVYALDAASGQPHWQTGDLAAGGTPALCGGSLYTGALGEAGPVLAAVDLASGEVRWWSQERAAFPYSRPACDAARGQVLVAGLDGRVLALDTAGGGLHWAHQAGEPFISDLTVAGGVVYGVTARSTLLALDAESGRLLARYTPPYAESSRAAPLTLDGRVYLVDGLFLYALEVLP